MTKLPEKRLTHYSAAIGSLVAAGSAAAAVQDVPPQSVESNQGDPGFYTYSGSLDVDGDGVNDFNVSGFYDTSQGEQGYISVSGLFTDDNDLPYNQVHAEYNGYVGAYVGIPMTAGETVDGTLPYSVFNISLHRVGQGGDDYEAFLEQRGFLGVEFDIPAESPHFGCMDIEITDSNTDGAPDLVVHGGVYDDLTDTPVDCASTSGGSGPPEAVAVPANGLVFWLTAAMLGGALLYNGQRRRRQSRG